MGELKQSSTQIIEPGGSRARKAWATTPERYDAALEKNIPGQLSKSRSVPRVAAISWSPDGHHLAFSVAGDPRDLRTGTLWSVNLNSAGTSASSTLVAASSSGTGYTMPVWTDNTNLAAVRTTGKTSSALTTLKVAKPSRSDEIVLPSSDFDWSPDMSRVVAAGPPTRLGGGRTPITTLKLITVQK